MGNVKITFLLNALSSVNDFGKVIYITIGIIVIGGVLIGLIKLFTVIATIKASGKAIEAIQAKRQINKKRIGGKKYAKK